MILDPHRSAPARPDVPDAPDALHARPLAHAAGRDLWLAGDGEVARLEVRDACGLLEVEVHLGPDGPRVRVAGARVEIDAGRALLLRADEVELAARRTLVLSGDDGVLLQGRHVGVRATRGDVAIAANDDVRVDGERIWLNR